MHLLDMNNTLVHAHNIQIYGSNYTLHLKSSISVFFFKNVSHIISTKKYEVYVFKHLVICVIRIYIS